MFEKLEVRDPIYLSGYDKEFKYQNGVTESMIEWNPLLVALAFDKIRIVHYLLRNCRVALKEAGRRPA